MAKIQPARRKTAAKKFVPEAELPQRTNYMILIAALAVIIAGYVVMAAGDATSPLSVTVAPIILVIGYCVVVPLGILYRPRKKDAEKAG